MAEASTKALTTATPLQPPPSYDEMANELNLFQVVQYIETVYRKHRHRTREFVAVILGFSGLPQNHVGSAGLHKYEDLLISMLSSLSEHFEDLRRSLRYFANNHLQPPPTSSDLQPYPMDASASPPEISASLLQEIHGLVKSIAKNYDRVADINRRMKSILFKRTEGTGQKTMVFTKAWQLIAQIEPNIEDWVRWIGTMDARAVCLKLDVEYELEDPASN